MQRIPKTGNRKRVAGSLDAQQQDETQRLKQTRLTAENFMTPPAPRPRSSTTDSVMDLTTGQNDAVEFVAKASPSPEVTKGRPTIRFDDMKKTMNALYQRTDSGDIELNCTSALTIFLDNVESNWSNN